MRRAKRISRDLTGLLTNERIHHDPIAGKQLLLFAKLAGERDILRTTLTRIVAPHAAENAVYNTLITRPCEISKIAIVRSFYVKHARIALN